MATEITEDTLEIEIGLLEAHGFRADGFLLGYPYPLLTPTGQRESRSFRVVVLENPYLKITLAPDLGGRILAIFDKRTQIEILDRADKLEPVMAGRRGVLLRGGLEIVGDGAPRLNSMGTVAYRIEQAVDDGEPGSVWIGEICGDGLSFNCCISLPPDRAAICIEGRFLNRMFEGCQYNGGIRLQLGKGESYVSDGAVAWIGSERDVALWISSDSSLFEGVEPSHGGLSVTRFEHRQEIAARQADTWTLEIVPYSGLGGYTSLNGIGAANLGQDVFGIQVSERKLGHKLVVQLESAESVETQVDLYPETTATYSLEEPPIRFALLDPGKNVVLLADPSIPLGERIGEIADSNQLSSGGFDSAIDLPTASILELRRATSDIWKRHLAYTLLGTRALASGNPKEAGEQFEQALLYNADDPLLWWAKTLSGRLAGEDLAERPELLNAHFLAPLEPALRAESFLSQPDHQGKDPSPLLSPLEDTPEAFIEVACLLIECGLFGEATKWIDESLRHVDLPMLRYLQAFAYLEASPMSVDAAQQVAEAGRQPIGPPYPWRPIERTALVSLLKRFPSDVRVKERLELLHAAQGVPPEALNPAQ